MDSNGDDEAAVMACGDCGDCGACKRWIERMEEAIVEGVAEEEVVLSTAYDACEPAVAVESGRGGDDSLTPPGGNWRGRMAAARTRQRLATPMGEESCRESGSLSA